MMSFFKKTAFFKIFLMLSVLMAFLCLLSFVFFDIGLLFDGSYVLYLTAYNEDFYFSEISRRTSDFLKLLPVWLFLNGTDSGSLPALIKIHSFGLIWIHIISLAVCYFILPSDRKRFFFFPVFAFFTGPLTALSMSISSALSVCSLVWAVAFILHYSDLSLRSHRLFLILSILPLFQSHELMSYMSLFFMGLCLLKYQKEKNLLNRCLLIACFSFFIFLFVFHVFDFFYLQKDSLYEHTLRTRNKDWFLNALISLRFLEFKYLINISVLIPILLKICFLIEFFIKRNKIYYFLGLFLLALFLKHHFYLVLFPLDYLFEGHARVYPPVISLPFGLLIWIMYEKKIKSFHLSKLFLLICFLGFISLTVYRIQSDRRFYKKREDTALSISKCKGAHKYSVYGWYKHRDYVWNLASKTILYPKKRDINMVLINDRCYDYCKSEKQSLLKQEVCESICNSYDLKFPKILLDPDFKLEQRFFNFKPLYEAYSKGISTCSTKL